MENANGAAGQAPLPLSQFAMSLKMMLNTMLFG
jgi:hypothetical protein